MNYTDEILEQKIEDLKKLIKHWAVSRDAWKDSGFTTYLDHFNDEPGDYPAVLVLYSDGELLDVFSYDNEKLALEFEELLDKTEFFYELHNHYTAVFYPSDDELNKPFNEYFEWQWICKLLEPDYTSLYEEVFNLIGRNPKKLHDLEHRKFEIFIHELFKNQGYETELGAGTGDGGVDVTIYKKDEIDQIVTLIQAKKYNEKNPIKLEAVAALKAHVDDQKANRGLFVTTSRYLPGVKDFAGRQNKKLILADKIDVKRWSNITATRIIKDKSTLISDQYIINLINNRSEKDLCGKVIHAQTGYNMITNDFCLILKDTKNAILAIRLKTRMVESFDPPHNFRGKEIPILDHTTIQNRNRENVFRAKKSIDNFGTEYYWGQQNLYSIWDGSPRYFDLLD